MLRFWKTSAAATAMRREAGILDGNGSDTVFDVDAAPDHVRKYSASTAWGLLLTVGTDYTYSSAAGTVTMSAAPTASEKIVAISAGEYIFKDQTIRGNSTNVGDRTMEQKLWLAVDGVNATDVNVAISDYFVGGGLATAVFYLADDSGGSPGSYGAGGASLSLGDIDDAQIVPFWVKLVAELGTEMDNYHDIHLIVESVNWSLHL